MTLVLLISKVQITLKCSGLLVSALSSGWNSPDLSPGQGHCVMFLGETLLLSSRGSRNTPRAFSIYKKFRKISIGNFRLGKARSICHKSHSFTGPSLSLL